MKTYGQRISVVGTTGSGKTTVAKEISKSLQLPYVELDALYWDENWTGVSDAIFRDRVEDAIKADQWVIDGNYSRVRNLVWERAETVVYLDYSFLRTFWQLLKRTLRRSITKEELWSNNQESFGKSLFSHDAIMLWMIRTYNRRRKQYAQLMNQSEYAHLKIVHLKTPRMTNAWVRRMTK